MNFYFFDGAWRSGVTSASHADSKSKTQLKLSTVILSKQVHSARGNRPEKGIDMIPPGLVKMLREPCSSTKSIFAQICQWIGNRRLDDAQARTTLGKLH